MSTEGSVGIEINITDNFTAIESKITTLNASIASLDTNINRTRTINVKALLETTDFDKQIAAVQAKEHTIKIKVNPTEIDAMIAGAVTGGQPHTIRATVDLVNVKNIIKAELDTEHPINVTVNSTGLESKVNAAVKNKSYPVKIDFTPDSAVGNSLSGISSAMNNIARLTGEINKLTKTALGDLNAQMTTYFNDLNHILDLTNKVAETVEKSVTKKAAAIEKAAAAELAGANKLAAEQVAIEEKKSAEINKIKVKEFESYITGTNAMVEQRIKIELSEVQALKDVNQRKIENFKSMQTVILDGMKLVLDSYKKEQDAINATIDAKKQLAMTSANLGSATFQNTGRTGSKTQGTDTGFPISLGGTGRPSNQVEQAVSDAAAKEKEIAAMRKYTSDYDQAYKMHYDMERKYASDYDSAYSENTVHVRRLFLDREAAYAENIERQRKYTSDYDQAYKMKADIERKYSSDITAAYEQNTARDRKMFLDREAAYKENYEMEKRNFLMLQEAYAMNEAINKKAMMQRGAQLSSGGAIAISSADIHALREYRTEQERLHGSTQNISQVMYGFNNVMMQLGIYMSVHQLTEYADHWMHFTSTVRVAMHQMIDSMERITGATDLLTKEQQKLLVEQKVDEVFKISQDTRTSIEDTATLFGRMSRAVESMGMGNDKAMIITKELGQALMISGLNAQTARGALLQLEQALGGVVVRGQEFKSVNDGIPIIMQTGIKHYNEAKAAIEAMNAGYERGTAKFNEYVAAHKGSVMSLMEGRQLMLQGRMYSAVLAEAILEARGELDALSKDVEVTFGQSFNMLGNAFTKYIGQLNESSGASKEFNSFIKDISDNFNTYASVAMSVVAGIATLTVGMYLAAAATNVWNAALTRNPLMLIAAALVTVGTALYTFKNANVDAATGTNLAWDAFWKTFDESDNPMIKMFKAIKVNFDTFIADIKWASDMWDKMSNSSQSMTPRVQTAAEQAAGGSNTTNANPNSFMSQYDKNITEAQKKVELEKLKSQLEAYGVQEKINLIQGDVEKQLAAHRALLNEQVALEAEKLALSKTQYSLDKKASSEKEAFIMAGVKKYTDEYMQTIKKSGGNSAVTLEDLMGIISRKELGSSGLKGSAQYEQAKHLSEGMDKAQIASEAAWAQKQIQDASDKVRKEQEAFVGTLPKLQEDNLQFIQSQSELQNSMYKKMRVGFKTALVESYGEATKEIENTVIKPRVATTTNEVLGFIDKYAAANSKPNQQIDPNMVKAIIQRESSWKPNLVNPESGATGLMQVMPANFQHYGVTNPNNSEQIISAGTKILSEDLKQFHGDIKLALAAYNWGGGNVKEKAGGDFDRVPQKVKNYVQDVLKYYQEFVAGKQGKLAPETIASIKSMAGEYKTVTKEALVPDFSGASEEMAKLLGEQYALLQDMSARATTVKTKEEQADFERDKKRLTTLKTLISERESLEKAASDNYLKSLDAKLEAEKKNYQASMVLINAKAKLQTEAEINNMAKNQGGFAINPIQDIMQSASSELVRQEAILADLIQQQKNIKDIKSPANEKLVIAYEGEILAANENVLMTKDKISVAQSTLNNLLKEQASVEDSLTTANEKQLQLLTQGSQAVATSEALKKRGVTASSPEGQNIIHLQDQKQMLDFIDKATGGIDGISQSLGGMFTQMITQGKSATQALGDMFKSMLDKMISAAMDFIAQGIVKQLFSGFTGGAGLSMGGSLTALAGAVAIGTYMGLQQSAKLNTSQTSMNSNYDNGIPADASSMQAVDMDVANMTFLKYSETAERFNKELRDSLGKGFSLLYKQSDAITTFASNTLTKYFPETMGAIKTAYATFKNSLAPITETISKSYGAITDFLGITKGAALAASAAGIATQGASAAALASLNDVINSAITPAMDVIKTAQAGAQVGGTAAGLGTSGAANLNNAISNAITPVFESTKAAAETGAVAAKSMSSSVLSAVGFIATLGMEAYSLATSWDKLDGALGKSIAIVDALGNIAFSAAIATMGATVQAMNPILLSIAAAASVISVTLGIIKDGWTATNITRVVLMTIGFIFFGLIGLIIGDMLGKLIGPLFEKQKKVDFGIVVSKALSAKDEVTGEAKYASIETPTPDKVSKENRVLAMATNMGDVYYGRTQGLDYAITKSEKEFVTRVANTLQSIGNAVGEVDKAIGNSEDYTRGLFRNIGSTMKRVEASSFDAMKSTNTLLSSVISNLQKTNTDAGKAIGGWLNIFVKTMPKEYTTSVILALTENKETFNTKTNVMETTSLLQRMALEAPKGMLEFIGERLKDMVKSKKTVQQIADETFKVISDSTMGLSAVNEQFIKLGFTIDALGKKQIPSGLLNTTTDIPSGTTANPDYDFAGYVKKYGIPDQSKGQNLTSEFKLPTHITFSNESKYSSTAMQGGSWAGSEKTKQWQFTPSEFNLSQHSVQEYKDYFENAQYKGTTVKIGNAVYQGTLNDGDLAKNTTVYIQKLFNSVLSNSAKGINVQDVTLTGQMINSMVSKYKMTMVAALEFASSIADVIHGIFVKSGSDASKLFAQYQGTTTNVPESLTNYPTSASGLGAMTHISTSTYKDKNGPTAMVNPVEANLTLLKQFFDTKPSLTTNQLNTILNTNFLNAKSIDEGLKSKTGALPSDLANQQWRLINPNPKTDQSGAKNVEDMDALVRLFVKEYIARSTIYNETTGKRVVVDVAAVAQNEMLKQSKAFMDTFFTKQLLMGKDAGGKELPVKGDVMSAYSVGAYKVANVASDFGVTGMDKVSGTFDPTSTLEKMSILADKYAADSKKALDAALANQVIATKTRNTTEIKNAQKAVDQAQAAYDSDRVLQLSKAALEISNSMGFVYETFLNAGSKLANVFEGKSDFPQKAQDFVDALGGIDKAISAVDKAKKYAYTDSEYAAMKVTIAQSKVDALLKQLQASNPTLTTLAKATAAFRDNPLDATLVTLMGAGADLAEALKTATTAADGLTKAAEDFKLSIKDWVANAKLSMVGNSRTQMLEASKSFDALVLRIKTPVSGEDKQAAASKITAAADSYANTIKAYYGTSKTGIDKLNNLVDIMDTMPETLTVAELQLGELQKIKDGILKLTPFGGMSDESKTVIEKLEKSIADMVAIDKTKPTADNTALLDAKLNVMLTLTKMTDGASEADKSFLNKIIESVGSENGLLSTIETIVNAKLGTTLSGGLQDALNTGFAALLIEVNDVKLNHTAEAEAKLQADIDKYNSLTADIKAAVSALDLDPKNPKLIKDVQDAMDAMNTFTVSIAKISLTGDALQLLYDDLKDYFKANPIDIIPVANVAAQALMLSNLKTDFEKLSATISNFIVDKEQQELAKNAMNRAFSAVTATINSVADETSKSKAFNTINDSVKSINAMILSKVDPVTQGLVYNALTAGYSAITATVNSKADPKSKQDTLDLLQSAYSNIDGWVKAKLEPNTAAAALSTATAYFNAISANVISNLEPKSFALVQATLKASFSSINDIIYMDIDDKSKGDTILEIGKAYAGLTATVTVASKLGDAGKGAIDSLTAAMATTTATINNVKLNPTADNIKLLNDSIAAYGPLHANVSTVVTELATNLDPTKTEQLKTNLQKAITALGAFTTLTDLKLAESQTAFLKTLNDFFGLKENRATIFANMNTTEAIATLNALKNSYSTLTQTVSVLPAGDLATKAKGFVDTAFATIVGTVNAANLSDTAKTGIITALNTTFSTYNAFITNASVTQGAKEQASSSLTTAVSAITAVISKTNLATDIQKTTNDALNLALSSMLVLIKDVGLNPTAANQNTLLTQLKAMDVAIDDVSASVTKLDLGTAAEKTALTTKLQTDVTALTGLSAKVGLGLKDTVKTDLDKAVATVTPTNITLTLKFVTSSDGGKTDHVVSQIDNIKELGKDGITIVIDMGLQNQSTLDLLKDKFNAVTDAATKAASQFNDIMDKANKINASIALFSSVGPVLATVAISSNDVRYQNNYNPLTQASGGELFNFMTDELNTKDSVQTAQKAYGGNLKTFNSKSATSAADIFYKEFNNIASKWNYNLSFVQGYNEAHPNNPINMAVHPIMENEAAKTMGEKMTAPTYRKLKKGETSLPQGEIDAADSKAADADYTAAKKRYDAEITWMETSAVQNAYFRLLGYNESTAGLMRPYATGGVFTNQIVSTPTPFNMGVMGEAGPEAIMPLARTSGGLGIRAVMAANDNNNNSEVELAEVKKQNQILMAQNAILQEGFKQLINVNNKQAESLDNIETTNRRTAA